MVKTRNVQVFLEISCGVKRKGRVVIELFAETTPLTCENFRALCTGDKGTNEEGVKLHYLGSKIHKIVPGTLLIGGDLSGGSEKGITSIYGGAFADENFNKFHIRAGSVCMNSFGKDKNGSQFFICTAKERCKWLEKKHVVIGHVVEGLDWIRSLERFCAEDGTPTKRMVIEACGRIKKKKADKPAENDVAAAESSQSDATGTPRLSAPECTECGGAMRYVKRIAKKQAVRFICKSVDCEHAVYLPDVKSEKLEQPVPSPVEGKGASKRKKSNKKASKSAASVEQAAEVVEQKPKRPKRQGK